MSIRIFLYKEFVFRCPDSYESKHSTFFFLPAGEKLQFTKYMLLQGHGKANVADLLMKYLPAYQIDCSPNNPAYTNK